MQNDIENMLCRTRFISLHMMLPVTTVILFVDAIWPPIMAKPGCQAKCGNVTIPYPFGMGPNCYYNDWYSITCGNFTPSLSKFGFQVLSISLDLNRLVVDYQLSFNCTSGNSTWTSTDFNGSPYKFSINNVFGPVNCPAANLSNGRDKLVAQCSQVCDLLGNTEPLDTGEVCLVNLPYSLTVYSVNFSQNGSTCSYVFLVQGDYMESFSGIGDSSIGQNGTHIPVVLDWQLEHLPDSSSENDNPNNNPNCLSYEEDDTYSCQCKSTQGFSGNPYLRNGCQHAPACDRCNGNCSVDVDDSTRVTCIPSTKSKSRTHLVGVVIGLTVGIGSLFLAFGGYWLWLLLKRRKEMKQWAQNFKRNGGLLLQQQISSRKGVVEKATVFTVSELEVATDHFNQNRILGQGGQGTVYKGMLADGKIIAVKKSKKVDENQLAPFINEVVILSQINHRNVVKLLECCLETDVPDRVK